MNRGPVFALTIWQPYAWCITRGYKPVENRSWRPPKSLIGRYLMIHAGKQVVDAATAMRIEEVAGHPIPGNLARGAIVGCAKVTGVVSVAGDTNELEHYRREELVVSPWTNGPYAWVLEDPVEFAQPIPCGGKQKLWTVAGDVYLACRNAYAKARDL